MNAKQKAKELVDEFNKLGKDYTRGVSMNEFAKQCALITVNEILKVAFYATDEIYNHYLEVKNEIEQL